MAAEGESLESLLNKATSPLTTDEDWDAILAFCDQINKELEGPQIAIRLLAHKIQSPQEKEALLSLSTLESCVKNCGRRFHQEIGKFRFLNEIIKVVSPKYLGNHTTEKVKQKCIELLYSWSEGLRQETKVAEAYQMLKKQGIVKQDPTYVPRLPEPPPPAPKNATFEDEDKSKLLSRLLKSKHPEDLQAANRLIKNMVKQDADRMEKVSRRVQQIETTNNNIRVLKEMMQHFRPGSASDAEKDLMKELYDNLEKARPNLFRLASDTDDLDNDAISDILKTNDDVLDTITKYKKLVLEGDESEGMINNSAAGLIDMGMSREEAPSVMSQLNKNDLDMLSDIFTSSGSDMPSQSFPTSSATSDIGMLNLSSAGPPPIIPPPMAGPSPRFPPALGAPPTQTINWNPGNVPGPPGQNPLRQPRVPAMGISTGGFTASPQPALLPSVSPATGSVADPQPEKNDKKGFDVLEELGKNLMQQTLSTSSVTLPCPTAPSTQNLTLNQLASKPVMAFSQPVEPTSTTSLLDQAPPLIPSLNPGTSPIPTPPSSVAASPMRSAKTVQVQPLTTVSVSLQSVKPGEHPPVTAYEKNNVKVVVHMGKDRPRPDVLVMVLSIMSTHPSPIKGLSFQAAVPKLMKVKLQPPSGTDLPAYNPILPPTAITQVMLIANPSKEKIRLKFKMCYSTADSSVTDVGEVDTFQVQ